MAGNTLPGGVYPDSTDRGLANTGPKLHNAGMSNRHSKRRTPRHATPRSNPPTPPDVPALVCQAELFRGLSQETCRAILAAGRMQYAPAGTIQVCQGNPSTTCYVVLSGEIRLAQLTPEGKRVIIDIIGSGAHLAFFVTLSSKPYPVSAEIIEDSYLYAWDAETMRQLIVSTPRLTMNALSALSDRVVCLQTKVQQLATERVEQRIAHSLLTLAQHAGVKQPEGILINMPVTHRDLAEMSGTNIYSVSRVLHKWEEDDIIATGRKRILLCKPERLTSHS